MKQGHNRQESNSQPVAPKAAALPTAQLRHRGDDCAITATDCAITATDCAITASDCAIAAKVYMDKEKYTRLNYLNVLQTISRQVMTSLAVHNCCSSVVIDVYFLLCDGTLL